MLMFVSTKNSCVCEARGTKRRRVLSLSILQGTAQTGLTLTYGVGCHIVDQREDYLSSGSSRDPSSRNIGLCSLRSMSSSKFSI